MIAELRQKIYELGAPLTSFYYRQAPDRVFYPYAVFLPLTSPASQDSVSKFETVYLQIAIYSNNAQQLETLEEAFKNTFDNGRDALTSASWYCDQIQRLSSRDIPGDVIHSTILEYKIELTHK